LLAVYILNRLKLCGKQCDATMPHLWYGIWTSKLRTTNACSSGYSCDDVKSDKFYSRNAFAILTKFYLTTVNTETEPLVKIVPILYIAQFIPLEWTFHMCISAILVLFLVITSK